MRLLLGIALSSLSALAFEVTLTRLFSIALRYHFAYMAVSIAMLGIAASGTAGALFERLKERRNLPVYALLLSALMPLAYLAANAIAFDPVVLAWDRTEALKIPLYYLTLSTPFFFFGLIISGAFYNFRERTGQVYGADLLGAGAGSVAILLLMSRAAPERAVFMLSAAAALGGLLMAGEGRHKIKATAALFVLLSLAVFALNPAFTAPRLSPYKGLRAALLYPDAEHMATYEDGFRRLDFFKSPLARFAPGMSLGYLKPLPEQTGFTTDGGSINALTDAKGDLGFLKRLPAALPYEMANPKDVLILGPKGGLHVLLAKQYGAENIYKIEPNGLLVDVLKEDYGEFTGGIYDRNTLKGLGRSRMGDIKGNFDVIDLPLTAAVPSGRFGVGEDYRFTVEAFAEYLGRLTPDGLLSITLFIVPPPRTELRLLATALKAMENMGIKEPGAHVAALRSWGTVTLLFKRTPFSPAETASLKEFSNRNRFDLVYYPGIKRDETNRFVKMQTDEYHLAFTSLIEPGTREAFVNNYLFDIGPATDERPFFNHYLKLTNIRETYKVMGRRWHYFLEEGYLLPAVLIQAVLISLALVLLPIRARGAGAPAKSSRPLLYFALLGVGFMFVEVPLIQKTVLALESPQHATASVLASVLISSGLGSLMGQRYPLFQTRGVVAALSVTIVIYALAAPTLLRVLTPLPLMVKTVGVFLIVLPPGFLMGLPFPMGIRAVDKELVPWAWAVNGCFSVVAPIAAVLLAMTVGYQAVMLLGAAAYALAFTVMGGAGGAGGGWGGWGAGSPLSFAPRPPSGRTSPNPSE